MRFLVRFAAWLSLMLLSSTALAGGYFDGKAYSIASTHFLKAGDLSGATYNTKKETLIFLNENGILFETDEKIKILRTIKLHAAGLDLEGITYIKTEENGTDRFAFNDEKAGQIIFLSIPPKAVAADLSGSKEVFKYGVSNIEALATDPASQDKLFYFGNNRVLDLKDPKKPKFKLVPHVKENGKPTKKNRHPGGTDMRAMYRNSNLSPNIFYLLKGRAIYETTPDGKTISKMPLPQNPAGWGKTEGLVIHPKSKLIYICKEGHDPNVFVLRPNKSGEKKK